MIAIIEKFIYFSILQKNLRGDNDCNYIAYYKKQIYVTQLI